MTDLREAAGHTNPARAKESPPPPRKLRMDFRRGSPASAARVAAIRNDANEDAYLTYEIPGEANAPVECLAEGCSDQGRARGLCMRHYSAARHMRGLPDPDEQWKLNNNFTSRYARLLLENEPELEGLFEIRSLRSVSR